MIKKVVAVWMVLFVTATMAMSISQLNKASKEELMQIKGIGEKKAEAIIKARKKGKFTSYDDVVQRVPGVGEQIAANLKADVKNGEASKKAKKKSAKKSEDKVKEVKKAKSKAKKEAQSKKSKAKKAEDALNKSKKKAKKTKATKKAKKAA